MGATMNRPPPSFLPDVHYPAITLWQPWASWIACGWKTVETREHRRFASLAGLRIAIHAGQRWDDDWRYLAAGYLTPEHLDYTYRHFRTVRGRVVCMATVREHRELYLRDSAAALCDAAGLYGLVLTDVAVWPEPLPPVSGSRLIWTWTPPRLCPAPVWPDDPAMRSPAGGPGLFPIEEAGRP